MKYDFYEHLRLTYMAWVAPMDFSDLINVFEVDYGKEHQEWYNLSELEQDIEIERAFRLKYRK